ncbi:MAG TPA: hypothetical protein VFO41_07035 [Alphaproteobacteria bacterium]|nr:hypothetical protein [Alphaproteobacteria bacterium]
MRKFLTGAAVIAVIAGAGTAWAGCTDDLTAQGPTPPVVTADTATVTAPVTPVPTQRPEG